MTQATHEPAMAQRGLPVDGSQPPVYGFVARLFQDRGTKPLADSSLAGYGNHRYFVRLEMNGETLKGDTPDIRDARRCLTQRAYSIIKTANEGRTDPIEEMAFTYP